MDAELELLGMMHEPPQMDTKAVAKWIAGMQGLLHRIRKAEKKGKGK